jgi:hypothetical protein
MKMGPRVQRATGWKHGIGKSFLICGAAALLGGCAERKAHAFPWATAVLVRPNPPAPRAANTDSDIAPDFRIEPLTNPGKIFTARPAPPRSRGQSPAPGENANGSKANVLVPELSAEESAAAKEQYSQSATVAERNLAAARGRNLTPGQLDAISKIHGFLTEAREASGEGDWGRARNLAKKAQILSEDLAASL